MFCKSLLPSPALQEFVRNYKILHLKFNNDFSIPFKHRPPKPEQGIVFYITGSVHLQNLNTGTLQTPAPVSVFSHQIDKKRFQVTSEFFMFTIFLHPGVLHRLIGMPMVDLNQYYHDAELFFGTEVRTVNEQLAASTEYSSMVPIMERFLLTQFKRMKMSSSVDTIANYLLADPTGFTLGTIARKACLSTKQFYRKFVERIGISPKFYSRITRFNHAYQYKIAHPKAYWSSIAQAFSYTDYHHLEKECKEFTGLTPNEWLKENQAAPERILQLR
jgi:AraC-like DNA-binding protein